MVGWRLGSALGVPTVRDPVPQRRRGKRVSAAAPDRPHLHRLVPNSPPPALYSWRMCRNIRTLYNFDPPATDEEVRASAIQYVRKISGFNKPSRANAEAFERAIDAVAAASAQLLRELETSAPPKDREIEAAKARARAAQRYAA